MGAAKRLLKFGLGGAVGTAVGVVVASLLAPQRGEDLQRAARSVIDEAKQAGAQAQAQTERSLEARFRQTVNDPNALVDRPEPGA